MKTKFFSACIGIAAVLFAFGFFIQSINPAKAQTNVGNNNTNSTSGRYQVSLSSCVDNVAIYYIAIVCDTETGKTQTYTATGGHSGWAKSSGGWNLPENPME